MKTLFLAVVLFFIVSVSRAQQSIHDTLPEMIPMQTLDEITVRPQYIRHQNNHYTIQVSPAEKGKMGKICYDKLQEYGFRRENIYQWKFRYSRLY